MAESDVVARRDVEVAIFVFDRAFERGKPLFQAFLVERIIARVLKRRREDKLNVVGA